MDIGTNLAESPLPSNDPFSGWRYCGSTQITSSEVSLPRMWPTYSLASRYGSPSTVSISATTNDCPKHFSKSVRVRFLPWYKACRNGKAARQIQFHAFRRFLASGQSPSPFHSCPAVFFIPNYGMEAVALRSLFQNAYRSESVTRFPRKFRGAKMSCSAPAVGSSWYP